MLHLTTLGQRIKMLKTVWLHRDDPVNPGETATCVLLHPDTLEAVLKFDTLHHSLNEYQNELSIFPPGHAYCFGEWIDAFEVMEGEPVPVTVLESVEEFLGALRRRTADVLQLPHSSGFGVTAALCTAGMLRGVGVWKVLLLHVLTTYS